MLLLMDSLTGCTGLDEAIEPEEEGTILCRSFTRIKEMDRVGFEPMTTASLRLL
jgi:hypothetical protein